MSRKQACLNATRFPKCLRMQPSDKTTRLELSGMLTAFVETAGPGSHVLRIVAGGQPPQRFVARASLS